jgi:ubiquinone/menaquinone biosynthesis C-methylase UbiE
MQNTRKDIFWKKLWDRKAEESIFNSTGRSYYDEKKFSLHLNKIIKRLDITKNSFTFLDCGGGVGLISWHLYPFFKKLYLFDYSKKLINCAKKKFKYKKKIKIKYFDIRNIKIFKDNIKFDRILIGSVLQYFNSYDEVIKLFKDLKYIINPKAIILFTENPDSSMKNKFFNDYRKLNLSNKVLKQIKNIHNKRLWLSYKKIEKIAKKNNYKIKKYNYTNNFLFEKKHMFDFALINSK